MTSVINQPTKVFLANNGVDIGGATDLVFGNEVGTLDIRTERTGGNIASISFYAYDDTNTATQYAAWTAVVSDNTDGTEDGRIDEKVMDAGTLLTRRLLKSAGGTTENTFYATENFNVNIESDRSAGTICFFQFKGDNSIAALTTYAQMLFTIVDGTSGSEDAKIEIKTLVAGTNTLAATFENGLIDVDNPITMAGVAVTAKARVEYDQVTPTVNNSFGVSSVTDNSTGNFTVNFSTNFANTGYFIGGIGPVNPGVSDRHIISDITRAVGSCTIEVRNSGGTLEDVDLNFLEFTAH